MGELLLTYYNRLRLPIQLPMGFRIGSYARDAALAQELQVDQLPALSVANVRELLQAVLPLPQLSPAEATRLVIQHLVKRAHSTASRLRTQRRARDPT